MKKLVLATLMCVAAMSAKAQVITSETVNNVYEEVSYQPNSDYVFNAEWTGKDITTMYVFKKDCGRKGTMMLKPHLKYEYSYANDGMLASRVTYHWVDSQDCWTCASRYDYTLANGNYSVEYSRYDHIANRFNQPVDKMVYTLMPNDDVNNVSFYHRFNPYTQFQLVSETFVEDKSLLFAKE